MNKILLTCSLLILTGCITGQPKVVDTNLTISELSNAVEKAWAEQAGTIASNGLRLKSVTLTAQVKESRSSEIGIELLVLASKAKTEATTSQSLTVKIAPPTRNYSLLVAPDLGNELNLAFQRASAISKQMTKRDASLELTEVSTAIGFDLVSSGSAGVKVELGPIKFGPGVSASVSGSHKIEMIFEKI